MPATAREEPRTVRVALPGGVELNLRAVGGEDEVFILDTGGALPGERATALLARCISDGERIAQDLTVGDREALLLHLRRLTFGETLDCVLRCPAEPCGEPLELALGVGDLLVAPYREVRASYEVAVEVEGESFAVSFRLPTAGDLDHVAALARSDPERGASEILRRCVLRATKEGAEVGAAELPAAVRTAIADAMAERDPQAELDLELRCPACGLAFSMVFDTAAFFLRELEERAAALLREVHTLALHYHWSETEILRMPARRRAQYLALLAELPSTARTR